MSELTKQALKVENNQSFPNNNAGLITPTNLRTFNENMIDSLVDEIAYNADSASFNNKIDALSGSIAVNTGSLLTTASFNNNTRNLTFTKGDSSTFSVNIPDVSGSDLPAGLVSGSSQINYPQISNIPSGIVSSSAQVSDLTGSFATTGSNVFVGNQTITGSLLISGSEVVTGPLTASRLQVNGNTDLNGQIDVSNNAFFRGDVYVQSSGAPFIRIRDTAGGGNSDGFDIGISTSSFVIKDDTHNIDFFEFDYDGVDKHTLKLEANEFQLNSGSVIIEQDLTASLQEGYAWVGNSLGKTQAVPTSSFGGGGTGNGFPFSGSAVITGSLEVSETIKSQVYINPQVLDGFTIPTGNNAMLVGPVAVSGSIVVEGNSNLIVLSQITSSGATPLPSGLLSSSVTDFTTYSASVDSRINNISVDTSSLATTGSNTFIGTQTITGSLFLSSSDAIQIIVPNFPGAPAPGGLSITGSVAVGGNFSVQGGNFVVGQINTPKIVGDGGTLDIVSNVKIFNDGNINNPRSLGVSGSAFVSQSISVGEAVRLSSSDPLPSGETGSLAVSGSNLYFFDGTWRQVSLV